MHFIVTCGGMVDPVIHLWNVAALLPKKQADATQTLMKGSIAHFIAGMLHEVMEFVGYGDGINDDSEELALRIFTAKMEQRIIAIEEWCARKAARVDGATAAQRHFRGYLERTNGRVAKNNIRRLQAVAVLQRVRRRAGLAEPYVAPVKRSHSRGGSRGASRGGSRGGSRNSSRRSATRPGSAASKPGSAPLKDALDTFVDGDGNIALGDGRALSPLSNASGGQFEVPQWRLRGFTTDPTKYTPLSSTALRDIFDKFCDRNQYVLVSDMPTACRLAGMHASDEEFDTLLNRLVRDVQIERDARLKEAKIAGACVCWCCYNNCGLL